MDHLTSESGSAIRVYDRSSKKLINRIYPHFQANNGGVQIGPDGETGIDGLFAAGEITTGMHGGDRIGGMMMTSCFVFGRRAGLAARLPPCAAHVLGYQNDLSFDTSKPAPNTLPSNNDNKKTL